MFKRICLKVNAENPQLPLMPSEPFEGSAATFEISDVPRAFARRRITGVTVNVTNVDGQTAAVACVIEGGVWSCTVPSAAIGASGFVGNGVIIAASGTDETGAAVPCWILGAGDLKVRRQDGTIEPGATRQTLHWFDERPESPKAGDVAPNPNAQDVLELFDGETWRGFGGGASIDFDDEPTEGSQNAARSGGIWSWVLRLLTGKLDKSGGTLTGGLTFDGEQFGIKFNNAYQSIKFNNGIDFSQRGILINGRPVYYPSGSGTLALTSDIPNVRYPLGAPITASARLADRTMNRVNALSTLTDAIDLSFPAAVEGLCRDFLVRVHRETGGVAINFTVPTGAAVFGDGFASAIGEGEDWLYAITETAANEWYVRAIKLEVAE